MSLKAVRLTYWISTIVFCTMMAFFAILYLTSADLAQAFVHLGFPSYFRVELAIFKLAGVAVLLLPLWPRWLKEWAYAGFFITLISAFIAHISSGDGPSRFMGPVVFGIVLICSYVTSKKMNSVEVKS
jgi:hypothetical protein